MISAVENSQWIENSSLPCVMSQTPCTPKATYSCLCNLPLLCWVCKSMVSRLARYQHCHICFDLWRGSDQSEKWREFAPPELCQSAIAPFRCLNILYVYLPPPGALLLEDCTTDAGASSLGLQIDCWQSPHHAHWPPLSKWKYHLLEGMHIVFDQWCAAK